MIRYIAVTDENGKDLTNIPETLIEAITPTKDGRAEIQFREFREQARESNNGYGTQEWRIDGYEIQTRYSVTPYSDLIDWLNGIPRPIMADIGPEEAAHIKRTLEGTRRTLDSITIPGPRPVAQTGLDSDVYALVRMLKDGEYAEHWAVTQFGQTLEAEITKLVGSENHKTSRLQKAEKLLHSVRLLVTEGGMYPIDDAETLRAVETFLENSTNC